MQKLVSVVAACRALETALTLTMREFVSFDGADELRSYFAECIEDEHAKELLDIKRAMREAIVAPANEFLLAKIRQVFDEVT